MTTTPTDERGQIFQRLAQHRRTPFRVCTRWLAPLLMTVACAARVVERPRAPAKPVPTLHRGPLSDFVSAAGLRWLLLIKPRALLADPALRAAVQRIVPSERFDGFAESSGVELRTIPEAAVAGFDYSTLYLAELPPATAELARTRFSDRLLGGARIKQPWPALIRISGVVGRTPETMLTLDNRVLAVAVGDPVPVKIVEGYAEQRLKNSPPALRGAALSTLPPLFEGNVAVLFAPGPFSSEWQHAAGGLLQSAAALAIAAQPIEHDKVATTIYVAGSWQGASELAAEELREAWTRFARSSAGHLFELSDVAEVSASAELLTLRVELQIEALVRGLRASVFGDLSQILNLPERHEPDPNPLQTE